MVDYEKRLVELDEVLNYLSKEDLAKIPEDIRQAIKENKSAEYTWEYDEEKSLKEQNLPRDTVILLPYLNMEYLLNKEQKELMEKIHLENEKKLERQKSRCTLMIIYSKKKEKKKMTIIAMIIITIIMKHH